MIPVEKLKAVTQIITHIDCPDGVASAMILRQVLPGVAVCAIQYETSEHKTLEAKPGMLFCDFSPHKSRVQEFRDAGAIVLDHHKSQKEVVESFGDLGVFADEKAEPGVCGAVLAFREVYFPLMSSGVLVSDEFRPPPIMAIKEFAVLAGIRDTWQKNDPRWLAACEQAEALNFWPFEELLKLKADDWPAKLALGPMLYERRLKSARKAIKNGVVIQTAGDRKILVFEGLRQTSDAAEMAGQEYSLVVGFGYVVDNGTAQLVYSTRSKKGFDCSVLALAHGGGGHSGAAGFKVDLNERDPQPYTLFSDLFGRFEHVEKDWRTILSASKGTENWDAAKAYAELVR